MRRHHKAFRPAVLLFVAAAVLMVLRTADGQRTVKLPAGPGADLVQAKCTLCHDLGNITSIRQAREEWDETIKVMIRRGAPITSEEAAVILDYLTKHFGR